MRPSLSGLVIDTETTGLTPPEHRIVSLAMIEIRDGIFVEDSLLYLVFNPGRKNSRTAFEIHGWSDEVLAHQDSFHDHAREIHARLAGAPVVVGHNLGFDLNFLRHEFGRSGLQMPECERYCTMWGARRVWPGQPAKLDDCLLRIGERRSGRQHGAAEDAALTGLLYLALHGVKTVELIYPRRPGNLREALR